LISSTIVTVSAAGSHVQGSHVQHFFRVVDANGQPVQYGSICLAPQGLTQRCAAIDPFGPTSFLVPEHIQDATVTVYVRGFEHTEALRLERRSTPYVIVIPVG
jgi:hypothetical protein